MRLKVVGLATALLALVMTSVMAASSLVMRGGCPFCK